MKKKKKKDQADQADQHSSSSSSSEDDFESDNDNDNAKFLGIARVYSGTLGKISNKKCPYCGDNLSNGTIIYALSPKYNPNNSNNNYLVSVPYKSLKFCNLLGRDYQIISSVAAGNVFGIIGLDDVLLKNGTISSIKNSYVIKPINVQSTPIVRVAIEPLNSLHMIPFYERFKIIK